MATMQLVRTEGKVFVRDPVGLFFGLVFPALLVIALGFFFPGFDEPASELNGLRYVDVYSNVAIALGIATLGLVTLPPILGQYRQFGILRRLRTTPVSPARLLLAQLVVHAVVAVLSAILAVTAAVVLFDVTVPEQPLWFLVSFVLAVASVFAIGLLVGARVRSPNAGVGFGMGIYFPLLFMAGLWVPRSVMPDGLLTVSNLTPLGSGVQALEDSWFGTGPEAMHLVIMLVWAVAIGFLAVRLFRWE
ncbi:MAG: ABC transporter permease [Acidimicrobiia bacterium]|nr:ABC transporter permease [Acidimicrobiia bacterium]